MKRPASKQLPAESIVTVVFGVRMNIRPAGVVQHTVSARKNQTSTQFTPQTAIAKHVTEKADWKNLQVWNARFGKGNR